MRAALITAAIVVALVVVSAVGAAGSRSLTDPAGDSGAAPDVVRVDVSNDDKGVLTFALAFANRSTLTGDDGVLIAIDTFKDTYFIYADWAERRYGLARVVGEDVEFDVPQETLQTSDGLTFRIDRSELGSPDGFGLYVATFAGATEEGYLHSDRAPDELAGMSHLWLYALQLTPQLRTVAPSFTPAKPKAGKRFAVTGARITLGTGEKVGAERVTCTAKLAGRVLRAAGRCAWNLPAGAKGKKLVVSLKVAYGGASRAAGPYTFTVGG